MIEKQTVTNRDWLNTLSNKEFAKFVIIDLADIGRCYTDSVGGVELWLSQERVEDD